MDLEFSCTLSFFFNFWTINAFVLNVDTEKRETRIFFASVGTELSEMFEPYIQKMNFAAMVNPQ